MGDSLRLDIWLYRSRFFKSRGLAANQIKSSKIRVTRNQHTQRVTKPHFQIRAQDRITFMRAGRLFTLDVLGLPKRRGPAKEAQSYYLRLNEGEDSVDKQG